jgi:hypothetical protein
MFCRRLQRVPTYTKHLGVVLDTESIIQYKCGKYRKGYCYNFKILKLIMYGIYYREFRHHVWLNPPAVLNGFLHSSCEKTNTNFYLGLSLCLHSEHM